MWQIFFCNEIPFYIPTSFFDYYADLTFLFPNTDKSLQSFRRIMFQSVIF